MWHKLKLILGDRDLRKKILFILGILAVFRLTAAIPIPGVDVLRLKAFFAGNQFFGLLNIFSGGALDNLSIAMLGVGPYITASIIMQLMTMLFPKLKEMYHEDGEAGRQRFNQYSRLLTVPLAMMQGFGLLTLLERQGVLGTLTAFDRVTNLIVIVAGAVFLMWLGELISEYGIGNGVSIMIFAGIVARIPQAMKQTIFTYDPSQLLLLTGYIIAAVLTVAAVIVVTEGERPIPISYAKRIRGSKVYGGVSTHLPLKVNQAGVIPIIFALSILLFPQMIASMLSGVGGEAMHNFFTAVVNFFNHPWVYASMYFILVFLFTYFYTAVTFEPHAIAENLQKSGAFVPGIRPGAPTADYLSKVISRITLAGAIFLGLIAVMPLAVRAMTGLTALTIGGTALLIAVSVVLDTVKKIDAQIVMREYE
ncbi:MAG: preprotein translocase subunit SecY [Candidatus Niyogibacteria bacterium]|nr:preprotein translocase subunit SecY [Candidatus Niyogibacteria bacterium]